MPSSRCSIRQSDCLIEQRLLGMTSVIATTEGAEINRRKCAPKVCGTVAGVRFACQVPASSYLSTATAVTATDGGNRAIQCSSRRCPMLRIHSLSPSQQRELRRWVCGNDFHVARRAQVVLWSARGWSVPAMAHAFGCCRRTVRRWVHAFLDAGLAGLRGRVAARRENHHGSTADSAIDPTTPASADHLVPVVPVSVPEVRRILAFHWFNHPLTPSFFWHWSTWRRYKQALAMRSHYQKRGTAPPDFEYLRL